MASRASWRAPTYNTTDPHAQYEQYDAAPGYSARVVPRRHHTLEPDDSISVRDDGDMSYYSQDKYSRYDAYPQSRDWEARDPYASSYAYDNLAVPYQPYEHDAYDLSRSGSHDPLVLNAAPPGNSGSRVSAVGSRYSSGTHKYQELEKGEQNEYPPVLLNTGFGQASPPIAPERPPWWQRQFRDTSPLEQRVEQYRKGIGVQDRPYLCWLIFVGCVVALIVECANNWKATGTPIAIHPTFNWLIGPSSTLLINSGARFDPCMKTIPSIINLPFACLNNTQSPITSLCSLEEICGFGGFGPEGPNQTFRFVLPIFLHAGLIHLAINMVVLLFSSAQVEKEMGGLRFLLLFVPSGCFGFILGGNFALEGLPSVGASGAIFGTHAAVFIDLLSHWDLEQRPKRRLFFLLVEFIIGLGLGYVPGVDNFSHLGGFAMGLAICTLLYPSLHRTPRHRWIVYGLRCLAAPLIVIAFVLLIRNFYTTDPNAACEWCRYLSCWPTSNNNYCKGTGLTLSDATTTTTRYEL